MTLMHTVPEPDLRFRILDFGFAPVSLARCWLGTLLLLLSASLITHAADTPSPTDRAALLRYAAASGERVWQAAQNPNQRNPSARDLFTYALALCEAQTNFNRLDRLFEIAAQMQCRDATNRGFGNFRWSWQHAAVEDFNAVDFCMQGGALLWLRHREAMPPAARARLREMLGFAVEGLKRHRVRPDYTNIALMNAGDLILLGEALAEPAVAAEGYARLDRIVLAIWDHGVHEYCSPTYYGVDLDDLVLIEAFARSERGRQQARALLELFWTDIALNWFPAAQKLAGTRSRDYDYLRGLGVLDNHLWAEGWLTGPPRGGFGIVFAALRQWQPPARLRELSEQRLPRLVRQSWGPGDFAVRTHWLAPDVTLSASGEYYGGWMDLPLTAYFAGERESVRCYYIPDGRHDPYGKFKIANGPHQKTLHLGPFFAGAQRRGDALGLCLYRADDGPTNCATLESHFVLPRAVDELWLGERRLKLADETPLSITFQPGDTLVAQRGTAAVGVRLPWLRGANGRAATAAFEWDTNRFGAVRLTVNHQLEPRAPLRATEPLPGAAFWVRAGSGLRGEAAFAEWRRAFARSAAQVEATSKRTTIRARGTDGEVAVAAESPFKTATLLEPPPAKVVLELDGEDWGRKILRNIEPVKSILAEQAQAKPIIIARDAAVAWEAESGVVGLEMTRGQDVAASGGAFVWMPGELGGKGTGTGSVSWPLQLAAAGEYFLWGRALTPTASDDSFTLSLRQGTNVLVPTTTWSLGVHPQWTWTRFTPEGARAGSGLPLPAGEVTLRLDVREDGTKLDRLFLTPRQNESPPRRADLP